MSTWLIGQLKIHNPAGYKEYASKVMSTMKKYGGELIGLSDSIEIVEGSYDWPRTVIIKFQDHEAALKWYHSPEYQEIIPLRKNSADGNIFLIKNQMDS